MLRYRIIANKEIGDAYHAPTSNTNVELIIGRRNKNWKLISLGHKNVVVL